MNEICDLKPQRPLPSFSANRRWGVGGVFSGDGNHDAEESQSRSTPERSLLTLGSPHQVPQPLERAGREGACKRDGEVLFVSVNDSHGLT